MGIQLRIALKDQTPQEIEYSDMTSPAEGQQTAEKQSETQQQPEDQQRQQQTEEPQVEGKDKISGTPGEKQVRQEPKEERAVPVGGNANGQG
jgi:hypothetical protein